MEQNLASKAFWVLRHRPQQLAGLGRGYLLFWWARLWRPLIFANYPQISLGSNVRLQRNSSLSAEKPDARIQVGDDTIIYENAKIEAYGLGKIIIGNQSILGDLRIYSRAQVSLGSRVITSWNVLIQDFDPHPVDPEQRSLQVESACINFEPRFDQKKYAAVKQDQSWVFPKAPVIIGDDVWLGANSTVLKGAKIGRGSVVAAGAVVLSGDYPERSLIAGNPARVIRGL